MLFQLFLNASSRGGQTGNFFSCEPFDHPPSLSVNGSLRFGNKSAIIPILMDHQIATKQTCPSHINVIVFDAAGVVQSLYIPDSVKNFNEYKKYFYNHIKVQTANVPRCDLSFDRHVSNSLKSPARAKRGTSTAVRFRATTVFTKKPSLISEKSGQQNITV